VGQGKQERNERTGGFLTDPLSAPYNFRANPLLIVLSGPSCAGKDAAIKQMKAQGFPFHFVITATTRSRRPGEVDGVDYIFLSRDEFTRMVAAGEFLEHAVVYGDYKGIPKSQVREAMAGDRDVIMRIDVQGAATVRSIVPEAVFIFLTPSSEREMVNRLRRRKTETPEELELRIATAREEIKRVTEFDYVVVNRDGALDQTVETIAAIITAEKCRVRQRTISL
jgi:guanylate kinase